MNGKQRFEWSNDSIRRYGGKNRRAQWLITETLTNLDKLVYASVLADVTSVHYRQRKELNPQDRQRRSTAGVGGPAR